MTAPRRGITAAITPHRVRDELFVLWSAARAEANIAYDAWCSTPGPDAYAVYRAAEDRADAAEVALSGADMQPASPSPDARLTQASRADVIKATTAPPGA